MTQAHPFTAKRTALMGKCCWVFLSRTGQEIRTLRERDRVTQRKGKWEFPTE